MQNKNDYITMLGTGNALATRCYNTCFTLHGEKGVLLVDAGGGNGILTQLEKAGIRREDISDLFQPYEKHHSTVLDAARLAEELQVKNLILYHTEDRTLDTRRERYTMEAKTVFRGQVFVPDDLERISLLLGLS